jgi:hypothetical protein
MQYRIKEVAEDGRSRFYPQWKKGWFWRRFVWWGGEDNHIPYTVFYGTQGTALSYIEDHKNRQKPQPRKIIYHTV